jgi:hypothetical protein
MLRSPAYWCAPTVTDLRLGSATFVAATHREHTMPDYAKIAYEAYAEHQDWKNYQGNPIPTWDVVRQDIKDAWDAEVRAVLDLATAPPTP